MIKRPSPLVQMTLALVGLCSMLVILTDLFFGVLPDRAEQSAHRRQSVSEAVAAPVVALLQADETRLLQRTLDGVLARTPDMRSIAIRRTDGEIFAFAGEHRQHWGSGLESNDVSTPERVTVPLNAGGSRWGSIELAFAADDRHQILKILSQPLMLTLGFMSLLGSLVFGLYMRRALQHLDPSSVIPERVQGAFDAMAEGVVVMDARGRVLLTNKSFRALHEDASTLRVGQLLSASPWLEKALPEDPEAHPWSLAISERKTTSGTTLEVAPATDDARHLVINCVPINDPSGTVRGCLATFDDVSELHRINQALSAANQALERTQLVVQRQNAELQHMATRDPMTGCLNRRAFHEALETMLAQALHSAQPVTCLMIDIDHFKSVNDTYGHQIGDRVIQEVAKTLMDCAGHDDLVARYGGEEFCVILRGKPLAAGMEFAERVRLRIQNECGAAVSEVDGMRVTASLGLEELSRNASSALELIDRADQALYRAKKQGRNRACAYHPSEPASPIASTTATPKNWLSLSAFDDAYEAFTREAQATGRMLSGIVFAVDSYRRLLTDRDEAHAEAAVREVMRIVADMARADDLLVRVNAEHLAVIARGLEDESAMRFAEAVRREVEQTSTRSERANLAEYRLTVSAGVDTLQPNAAGSTTLIQRAERALLRAKRSGRNQVVRFGSAANRDKKGPAGGKTARGDASTAR